MFVPDFVSSCTTIKSKFQVVNNSTVPFLGFVQDGALCMGFQDLGP